MRGLQRGRTLAAVALLLAMSAGLRAAGDLRAASWEDPALDDPSIERGLAEARVRTAQMRQGAPDPEGVSGEPREIAAALERCYRHGAPDVAARIVARFPETCATGTDLPSGAKSTARFEYDFQTQIGRLHVELTRSRADGALVVAFPPGTYAAAAHAGANPSDAERAQDLALVRAAVVVLEPQEPSASVEVPVACARWSAAAPSPGQAYVLRRFEPASRTERLLDAICAGERPPAHAAQLALWILHNGMTRSDAAAFVRTHSAATFDSPDPLLPGHAAEAERVLVGAGIDPRTTPFHLPSDGTAAPPRDAGSPGLE